MAKEPISLRALLAGAPRSLWALSRAHRDGWGLACIGDGDWTIRKGTACAAECADFSAAADGAYARLAIAHVRQKTVGKTSLENTHPFRRGTWVLAHNGTIDDLPAISARCSAARLAEVEGETDSERLFAFLMTSIDEAGDVERGLGAAVRCLRELPGVGAVTFLLSDGAALYAHRLGRTLFLLDRTGEPGRRVPSIAVASERLTEERWVEVSQGALLVIARGASPSVRALDAC